MADPEKTDEVARDSSAPDSTPVSGDDGHQQAGAEEPDAHSAPHAGADAEKNNKAPTPKKASKEPPGGYDASVIPNAPPGYTLKFTFHRATNLPMADINTFSSDPYIVAQISTSQPSRHKEDPLPEIRTHTVRRNTNPEWETTWTVANIPATGFKLKARIYDEDPADHDDRLGNVHVNVGQLDANWPGIQNRSYKIKKRMGSKRAYFVRYIAACFSRTKHVNGYVWISVELLGRTEQARGGRAYTVGPQWWTIHYSPLLGRIANRKETGDQAEGQKTKAERYK